MKLIWLHDLLSTSLNAFTVIWLHHVARTIWKSEVETMDFYFPEKNSNAFLINIYFISVNSLNWVRTGNWKLMDGWPFNFIPSFGQRADCWWLSDGWTAIATGNSQISDEIKCHRSDPWKEIFSGSICINHETQVKLFRIGNLRYYSFNNHSIRHTFSLWSNRICYIQRGTTYILFVLSWNKGVVHRTQLLLYMHRNTLFALHTDCISSEHRIVSGFSRIVAKLHDKSAQNNQWESLSTNSLIIKEFH